MPTNWVKNKAFPKQHQPHLDSRSFNLIYFSQKEVGYISASEIRAHGSYNNRQTNFSFQRLRFIQKIGIL